MTTKEFRDALRIAERQMRQNADRAREHRERLRSRVHQNDGRFMMNWTDQDTKELEVAIVSPLFSHSRARKWCGVWLVYIYHHDVASPTGIVLAKSGPEDIAVGLLTKHGRTSPLSPTEGFGRN